MVKNSNSFSAFFSTLWDKNVKFSSRELKNTKFDVNVSEMQNPVDFNVRFQSWSENIQSPFLGLGNV